MGIPMDDIHAPTVASGPTSGRQVINGHYGKLSLMELIAEKERVEAELKALGSVLDSHGVNMTTSLITLDGYPRDDLDIAQIRTTRARIIPLRNDYKDLMGRIETQLHEHHASLQQAESLRSSNTDISMTIPTPERDKDESQDALVETPFAKVNSVTDGSPAHQAGLKAGDGIRAFGHVNWMNHENLTKVAEVVQRNEGRAITVKVVRRNSSNSVSEEFRLQLTPRRNWGGRGMLGCHLLPA